MYQHLLFASGICLTPPKITVKMANRSWLLLSCMIAWRLHTAHGAITSSSGDVIAQEGEKAGFWCIVDGTASVFSWSHLGATVWYSPEPSDIHGENYEVNNVGNNCSLTISNVRKEDGGSVTFSEASAGGENKAMQLIIINAEAPVLSQSQLVDSGETSQQVDVTCTIAHSSGVDPGLTMRAGVENNMTPLTDLDESDGNGLTTTDGVLTYTVDWEDDGSDMLCEYNFNNPSYSHRTEYRLEIQYLPKSIEIYPQPDENGLLEVGSNAIINCSANGNPDPSFKWTSSNPEYSLTDSELVISEAVGIDTGSDGKEFVCTASNFIGGIQREVSRNITIKVLGGQTSSSSGRGNVAKIVAPVIICLVVIVVIVAAVLF